MTLGIQATAKELRQLRRWNQKCFENQDGSRTYVIRGKRWHHKVNGQWLDQAEVQALGLMLPMADTYGETVDGYIEGNSAANYASARSGSDSSDTAGTEAIIGQNFYDHIYYVRRAFLSFDTSGIEDSDTITAATLNVKAHRDVSDTDFIVQVYRFAWTEPLGGANQEANYDGAYGAGATLEGTFRNTSDGWSSGKYYSMSVATAGINVAGDTKYTMVSKKDVDNSAPTGAEYVLIFTADTAGTTSDPYLAITAVQIGFGAMF